MKRRKAGTTKRKSAKKRNLGRYKSNLEKTCADLLSESGLPFDYEKGVYHKMTAKKKDLTDRSNSVVLPIRYTPDFVAKDRSWIIETKGYTPSHHDFPMRWKLFLKHVAELGEPLPMLFICKNRQQIQQAIEIIKKDGKGDNKRGTRR